MGRFLPYRVWEGRFLPYRVLEDFCLTVCGKVFALPCMGSFLPYRVWEGFCYFNHIKMILNRSVHFVTFVYPKFLDFFHAIKPKKIFMYDVTCNTTTINILTLYCVNSVLRNLFDWKGKC